MSCAEISTSAGLSVYRELMGREQRSGLDWELNYGKDALMKTPDPQMMLNLGKFAKFSAVPLPLGSQLEALQRERNTQNASINRYEQQIFPFKSQVPVSELSVKYYGDDAWHSQPKTSGAPSSFVPPDPGLPSVTKRKWDVDRIQFVREGLGPVHNNSRALAAERARQ